MSTTPPATIATLVEELSSCRRVRSRLASSSDASLPRILAVLLPRLMRKMDDNYAQLPQQSWGAVSGGRLDSNAVGIGGIENDDSDVEDGSGVEDDPTAEENSNADEDSDDVEEDTAGDGENHDNNENENEQVNSNSGPASSEADVFRNSVDDFEDDSVAEESEDDSDVEVDSDEDDYDDAEEDENHDNSESEQGNSNSTPVLSEADVFRNFTDNFENDSDIGDNAEDEDEDEDDAEAEDDSAEENHDNYENEIEQVNSNSAPVLLEADVLRNDIHKEYSTVIDHILDRVGGNQGCVDTTPFVRTVADFVMESLCKAGYYEKATIMPPVDEDEWVKVKGEGQTEGGELGYQRKKNTSSKRESLCSSEQNEVGQGGREQGCGGSLWEQPGLNAALQILRSCWFAAVKYHFNDGNSHVEAAQSIHCNIALSVMKASMMALEGLDEELENNPRPITRNMAMYTEHAAVMPRGALGRRQVRQARAMQTRQAALGAEIRSQDKTDPWIEASWLLFESIAILSYIHPIGLSGASSATFNSQLRVSKGEEMQKLHHEVISSMVPLVGDGTYNLFIDLILFQPGNSYLQLSCGGLSRQGFARMQAPIISNNTEYLPLSSWIDLKVAVLKIASGSMKGEGVFGHEHGLVSDTTEEKSDGIIGAARALVLLILSSSGHGSSRDAHARKLASFAASSLKSHLGEGSTSENPGEILLPRKRAKKRKPVSQSCSGCENDTTVYAASMLLCLALGDARAHDMISTVDVDSRLLQLLRHSITASDAGSSNNNVMRSHLSPCATCDVIKFITDRMHFQKNGMVSLGDPTIILPTRDPNEEMALFVKISLSVAQIVLQLYEPNDIMRRRGVVMSSGWGGKDGPAVLAAKMLHTLVVWLNACHAAVDDGTPTRTWLQNARRQTIDFAMDFLKSNVIPVLSEEDILPPPQRGIQWIGENGVVGNPMVAEAPYRLRGRIAAHNRIEQFRKAGLVPPIDIRRHCIGIIQSVVKNCVTQATIGSYSDLPILLFNCLTSDDELSPHVAAALEDCLVVYKRMLEVHRQTFDVEALVIHSVAPLLPVLLSSATSEKVYIRRLAALWRSDVVRFLDPAAACFLGTYLVDDPDTLTSKAARECIKPNEAMVSSPQSKQNMEGGDDIVFSILFLDKTSDIGLQLLQTKLDLEIHALADQLRISEDSALILMQQHRFSGDKVTQSIINSESLEETLKHYGIMWRCRSLLPENEHGSDNNSGNIATTNHQCDICYDDDLSRGDMHSLPCGHLFCRECYRNLLQLRLVDSRTLADFSCPQAGCNERISETDVKELVPNQLVKWKEVVFENYISMSNKYKWCPGVDCPMVVFSEAGKGSANCTCCSTIFCFNCGTEPHGLAECSEAREFMVLRLNSSEWWITKNAKRCPGPGCNVPIQKNTGCNHMTCTSCGTHFCWICASIIGAGGNLERHICNRYDPSKVSGKRQHRDEFYLSRFEACADGEIFAKKQLESLPTKWKEDGSENIHISREELEIMMKATKALLQCCFFLKWTYVISWSEFSMEESLEKKIFESHQATLQEFAEKANKLTEMKLEGLYLNGGERRVRMHFHALAFHTSVLVKYTERMVEFISQMRKKPCRADEEKPPN